MKKIAPLFFLFLLITSTSIPLTAARIEKSSNSSDSGTAHSFSLIPQQGSSVRDPKPGEPGHQAPPPLTSSPNANCATGPRSSPFEPPKCDDSTFVTDSGAGLDTGCTFRNGGPLIFTIRISRHIGEINKLKEKGLAKATLLMPAFDVDFNASIPGVQPERDRVSINGRVVPGEFLRGFDNTWIENEFSIPLDFLNLPSDPGDGGSVTPTENIIRIDIDVANSDEEWCTSIDWAALSIKVPRPVVLVHGIFSTASTWNFWEGELNALGIPNKAIGNMAFLPQTIQTNAGIIAANVENLRRRWGVDKVNLVCHSKGGLDSREFVGRVDPNKSIEQLIQIGTPNAGAPLADHIIRGSLRLPPLISLPINAIALVTAPGGYQLTTDYMLIYNLFSPRANNVRYTALAGHYRPCTSLICSLLVESFLESILGGPSDLIVPVGSVHSLGYTENLLFQTVGGNTEAIHATPPGLNFISQTGSQGISTALSGRIRAFGKSSAARSLNGALPGPPSINFLPTASAAGTISQKQVRTHPIAIDQSATPVYFSIMYPSGDLDLALISPSGQRFDRETIIGNPNVARDDQPILGGRIEVYSFNNPEPGVWTVEVTAPSVIEPSGEVAYAVSGWIPNPTLTFTGSAERLNIRSGQMLRLLGTLRNNNSPVTGASVNAEIALPDNTRQNILMRDDGMNGDATANDGIYTGDFKATSQAGAYRILYTATRAASPGSPPFSREDFAIATVSLSSSNFAGKFSDFGLDADGDGLFNNLVIQTDLKITNEGSYNVFGTLTDSMGNTHETNVRARLGAGANTVMLSFDGEAIFKNRVDGPYTLSIIRLAEENGSDILPVDERANAHQTAAYSFRAFQHSPISLTGNLSAVGVDTNGNGLFDLLKVKIETEIVTPGFYNWSARLIDRNDKELGVASNSGVLTSGLNVIELDFDGETIGRNGVDGPYFVSGLLIFGSGGSLVSTDTLATEPFLASQFEGSFNICLQDDSSADKMQINSADGSYLFTSCSSGLTVRGTGVISSRGSTITLQHNSGDRRVIANMDMSVGRGTAALQLLSIGKTFSIVDRDILGNTCSCPSNR